MNVIIEGPGGNRRVAPAQGGRLLPGERVVDFLRDEEFEKAVPPAVAQMHKGMARIEKWFDALERWGKAPVGDRIGFITAALGIEECPRCQAWHQILNRVDEIGWSEAFQQMLAAWRRLRR